MLNTDYVVRLDEPKQKFDKQDVRDFNDEVYRYIDKLEEEVKRLRQYNNELVELLRIRGNKVNELLKENSILKELLPSQINERS